MREDSGGNLSDLNIVEDIQEAVTPPNTHDSIQNSDDQLHLEADIIRSIQPYVTRYGRRVKIPRYLQDYQT